jgi:di/tricarboxylate transporter
MPLEPFVLAVLFGANLSFVTPMAYQTNLLIMNAGGYKFGDFVKVGLPLALGLWVVLSTVLVVAYGL